MISYFQQMTAQVNLVFNRFDFNISQPPIAQGIYVSPGH